MRESQLTFIRNTIDEIIEHLETTSKTDKQQIVTQLKEIKRLHGFR